VLNRVPELDVDLFAEASLRDPVDDYRRLREPGRLIRLRRPDVYAMGRFDDVQAALRASEQLISGEGVGFSAALAHRPAIALSHLGA
jgi:cytochrome P450